MGHRRSTWGSLNLGSSGAAVNFAHRQPVFFLGRPSHFLSRSRSFLGFLTWLRLLLRVPAFSVTAGEVSTGNPIASDLARRNRVVFSQICSSLSGFYPSEATTEVAGTFCCIRRGPRWSHCRRRLFQPPESRRSSVSGFFPTQKRRLKCFRARFVCFITPCSCCPVILLR